MKNVKRKTIRKIGGTRSSGTSVWNPAKMRSDNSTLSLVKGDESIVSLNYNPFTTILYMSFYEKDAQRRQNKYKVDIKYSSIGPPNTIDEMWWRGPYGCMTGTKLENAEIKNNGSFGIPKPSYTRFVNTILPDPSSWVDEQLNAQDIKALYMTGMGDNHVDYKLYYFVNKRLK